MEKLQLLIGRLLLVGVLLSLLLVAVGGILYLYSHGHEAVHFHVFHSESNGFTSLAGVWQDLSSFSALGIIELGLLVLVFLQVLRVLLTTWVFIKLRDTFFIWASFFVLLLLILSLCWQV